MFTISELNSTIIDVLNRWKLDTKSTGYANDPIMATYKKHGFKGSVPKPYRIMELRDVVEGVLNTNGSI